MRIIAYVARDDDPEQVHAHLQSQPGVSCVGCRIGRLWQPGQYCESGWDAIYAPGFPGILAAYARAGVPAFEASAPSEPYDPRELAELPQADAATIVCHGLYARHELAAEPLIGQLDGPILVVNHSAELLSAEPEYVVSNDGFDTHNAGSRGRVQICRQRHSTTVCRPWYALDRLGITDSRFSVRCALSVAARAIGAKRIRLIGHDCVPGTGALRGHWDASHMSTCERETRADLVQLADSGIAIEHLRWIDDKLTVFDYRH